MPTTKHRRGNQFYIKCDDALLDFEHTDASIYQYFFRTSKTRAVFANAVPRPIILPTPYPLVSLLPLNANGQRTAPSATSISNPLMLPRIAIVTQLVIYAEARTSLISPSHVFS